MSSEFLMGEEEEGKNNRIEMFWLEAPQLQF